MILGVGLVMTAAIFPVAIKQSEESADQTAAARVARGAAAYLQQTLSDIDVRPHCMLSNHWAKQSSNDSADRIVNMRPLMAAIVRLPTRPFHAALAGRVVQRHMKRLHGVPGANLSLAKPAVKFCKLERPKSSQPK